ncbi:acetoacetyl-synthetase [Moniliophthora roreri]|nr:acetoacetyl-synthetase [Moniliophthora roreri]
MFEEVEPHIQRMADLVSFQRTGTSHLTSTWSNIYDFWLVICSVPPEKIVTPGSIPEVLDVSKLC